jgi:hypothetical protein
MLTKKLSQIQQQLKAPKSQYNTFGKYKYRNCEDILQAVKPLLGDCILVLQDEVVQIGERYYVKATASIRDDGAIESATAYAREEEVKKGMDGCQITGTASSYARKYALNGLLAIDDTRDDDTRPPDDNTESVKAIKAVIKTLDKAKQDEVSAWVNKKYGSLEKMPSATLDQLKSRLVA